MEHEKKTFAVAEVKSATSDNPNGEFTVVMSTDAVDRDGESIVKGAFDPLPESIPVHAFHDFSDPIGRAVPRYDEEGRLIGDGYFASTARAQEMRQLVADGVVGHSSVGFMAAERKGEGESPEIHSAELLEVSFVSVPSNREAAVLLVKDASAKVGARNSAKDSQHIQAAHDAMVGLGASCDGKSHTEPDEAPTDSTTEAPETPSEDGKSPASDLVEQARMRAELALLM